MLKYAAHVGIDLLNDKEIVGFSRLNVINRTFLVYQHRSTMKHFKDIESQATDTVVTENVSTGDSMSRKENHCPFNMNRIFVRTERNSDQSCNITQMYKPR